MNPNPEIPDTNDGGKTMRYTVEVKTEYGWVEVSGLEYDPDYIESAFATAEQAEAAMEAYQENYPETEYRVVEVN